MKHSKSLAADGTVELCEVYRTHDLDVWQATIMAYGTFGGGTVTLQASPDGGTTKIDMRDVSNSVVSITVNDMYNVMLGNVNALDGAIKVYAKLAGATSPDLDVDVFDNR